ncbi:MAG: hypothetical protein Q4F95_14470 [Oscillospiraceae bacterium]|nr:hypothetical protein [Oscillospiraceae bacterium]
MDIYYCPRCSGKPYTDNPKKGTVCPVCGAALRYENVNISSLSSRSKLNYPEKKTRKAEKGKSTYKDKRNKLRKYDTNKPSAASVSTSPEEIDENITQIGRKTRYITGIVENIRPSSDVHRDLFTKLRHYIFYSQSFSDTLYSFDMRYLDEKNHTHLARVNVYGDYSADSPTICSGIEHTVTGRPAVRNLSEDDKDIFFAKAVRNTENAIRFMKSPAAFFTFVYVLVFVAAIIYQISDPLMHGKLLDGISKIFVDFVPSAKAAVSMFAISFIFFSAVMFVNRTRMHIYYNFNSVCILSLMMTVMFFMKFPLNGFSGLSAAESFADVFACLITSSLCLLTAVICVWLIWITGCRIIRR